MGAIQDSAELASRNFFKNLSKKLHGNTISAVDYMDDGTPIQLIVTIDEESGSAVFLISQEPGQKFTVILKSHCPMPESNILTHSNR
jgi:hypothetical protein